MSELERLREWVERNTSGIGAHCESVKGTRLVAAIGVRTGMLSVLREIDRMIAEREAQHG